MCSCYFYVCIFFWNPLSFLLNTSWVELKWGEGVGNWWKRVGDWLNRLGSWLNPVESWLETNWDPVGIRSKSSRETASKNWCLSGAAVCTNAVVSASSLMLWTFCAVVVVGKIRRLLDKLTLTRRLCLSCRYCFSALSSLWTFLAAAVVAGSRWLLHVDQYRKLCCFLYTQ